MSLSPDTRLRRARDFTNAYNNGKSMADKKLVLFCYSRGDDNRTRIGFSISKKVGNAVIRNKTKRRLQGIMIEVYPLLKPGMDLVWIVRPQSGRIEFNDFRVSALALMSRAGLLERRP